MALTKSRGNMYPFVTHTWNAIKGICFHDCPYCYMKKFDGLLPIRFDPKELEVNLGEGNFIFVGSGTDAWAFDIPSDWITREPLIQFDLFEMVELVRMCSPVQVNIGRNSRQDITLPEPTRNEVQALITELQKFTRVVVKSNAKCWI